ncbi:MAG: hypothetical protein NTX56_06875 [Proteobacteria bacterium]|nr:hypothetical protein [Pseudomonadota bacterium]
MRIDATKDLSYTSDKNFMGRAPASADSLAKYLLRDRLPTRGHSAECESNGGGKSFLELESNAKLNTPKSQHRIQIMLKQDPKAHAEGYRARQQGKPLRANPYRLNSTEGRSWDAGYADGKTHHVSRHPVHKAKI